MKKIILVLVLLFANISPVHAETITGCEGVKTDRAVKKGSYLQCLANTDLAYFESFRGPMIVNFWGSWCGPCLDEIPYLRAFHKKYPKTALVGVDVEERDIENGRAFVIENKMNWPNFYDYGGSTRKITGVGVPVTIFINSKGKIVYRKIGVLKNTKELETLVKKYLGS